MLTDDYLDLPRLLAGSEGTLALFTEITVAHASAAQARGTVLFFFDLMEKAARAVEEILPFQPIACDVMDRRHLSLARETDPRYASLIPADGRGFAARSSWTRRTRKSCANGCGNWSIACGKRKRLAFDSRTATGRDDMELSWRLAQKVVPTLYRLKGSTQALPFVEDIAIPP